MISRTVTEDFPLNKSLLRYYDNSVCLLAYALRQTQPAVMFVAFQARVADRGVAGCHINTYNMVEGCFSCLLFTF